jgi:hypothetical protein
MQGREITESTGFACCMSDESGSAVGIKPSMLMVNCELEEHSLILILAGREGCCSMWDIPGTM